MATETTTEIAKTSFTTEQLKAITSFEDIANLARDTGAVVTSAIDLGDGFTLLEDKQQLVGKPCAFVTWNFSQGDFGEFVSARVVVQITPSVFEKYVLNDGSTGIKDQLKRISEQANGKPQMLYAPKGLRRSDFKFADPQTGEEKPATTFYIDTSGVGSLS